MTSIGNDAFTVGTAAVAAGGANIIAQKKNAIISAATTTKDAFVFEMLLYCKVLPSSFTLQSLQSLIL